MAFAILFVFAMIDSHIPLLAQGGLPTANSPGVQEVAGKDDPTTAEFPSDEKFPNINEMDGSFPVGGVWQRSGFAWIKFSIILLAWFVWLREMRLCVDDGRSQRLQVDRWGRAIFAFGLAGILTAILLPAYVLGACVLVASCGVPFWRFIRWRNAQVSDGIPRLGWRHIFISPDIPFRAIPDTQFELPSSLLGGTSIGKIVLLGKSFSDGVTHAAANDEAGRSSGLQMALALIGHAVARRATDIHVGTKDDRVILRLRIDGELIPLDPITLDSGLSVINVFKVLSDLNIADKRHSQDGSFRADVDGRRLCFRVSSQGTNLGEKLSIRILDPAENFSTFSALGVTDQMQERLTTMLGRSSGLILFVGATGAGKSTTAYAGLRYLDSGERNIVTIEEPIEYSLPSIDQIEVKTRAGQTFESALRSLLRQDADVVLIGEIRDTETARIACQAAMTGQLVLSTLHATDSISAVFRMVDLGVDCHNIAAALRGVVSQQLVRRLCTKCRTAYTPDDEALQNLGLWDFRGELYHSPDPLSNPCLNCNSRGFLGRIGIFELLEVTPEIRDLIRDRLSAAMITSAAEKDGMTTLWDDGLRLVREGIISPQEFHRVVDEA